MLSITPIACRLHAVDVVDVFDVFDVLDTQPAQLAPDSFDFPIFAYFRLNSSKPASNAIHLELVPCAEHQNTT